MVYEACKAVLDGVNEEGHRNEIYGADIKYVEAEWVGSPELAIGEVIRCSSLQDKTEKTYEIYFNEFTLNGDLRVRSKLRKV